MASSSGTPGPPGCFGKNGIQLWNLQGPQRFWAKWPPALETPGPLEGFGKLVSGSKTFGAPGSFGQNGLQLWNHWGPLEVFGQWP